MKFGQPDSSWYLLEHIRKTGYCQLVNRIQVTNLLEETGQLVMKSGKPDASLICVGLNQIASYEI